MVSMTPHKQILFSVTLNLFICVGLITATKPQWALSADECRTPNGDVGTCKSIKECKALVDFIHQSLPLTANTIEILKNHHCGFEGKSVKVCCREGQIMLKPQSEKPTIPPAPDVSNHRNLNLLPEKCGSVLSTPRLMDGNKAYLLEFPWMALLVYKTGKRVDFRCSGTVINNRYILTAARCITNHKLIGVRLGDYNITSPIDCEREPFGDEFCVQPVQDILVEETIPHPKYNGTSFTDNIGLIRLASPISIDLETVSPICLPITEAFRNKKFVKTRLTVAGWGVTETGRKNDVLLKAHFPMISEEQCRKMYGKSRPALNYKLVCADVQKKIDSCGVGDSGGPLQIMEVYKNDVCYIQHGVASFGHELCERGFPSVFTRVDYYMEWILDNLKV